MFVLASAIGARSSLNRTKQKGFNVSGLAFHFPYQPDQTPDCLPGIKKSATLSPPRRRISCYFCLRHASNRRQLAFNLPVPIGILEDPRLGKRERSTSNFCKSTAMPISSLSPTLSYRMSCLFYLSARQVEAMIGSQQYRLVSYWIKLI